MVDFVGAGPGAKDLITVRGRRLLEEAQVIIYTGSLVNPALLEYAGEECRIYNSAYMDLEEVIAVMTEAEAQGKRIVRLHTGDPGLYGAIREQMDRLKALGIDYEVCPGVSSFCAAAAAMKAEYTLPGVSQTVIITRMEGRTPVPEREKIRALAAHQATMVIFLSAGRIRELAKELMAGGYAGDTPSAICYKVSFKEEQILRCPLAQLYETAQTAQITKTALITVGRFLGDDYELSKLYDSHFETEYRKGKNGCEV